MKKVLLVLPLIVRAISGCSPKHVHSFDKLEITRDADWRTYIVGNDFNTSGLEVSAVCKECHQKQVVEYSLENNTELELDQTSVTIKYDNLSIDYEIIVKEEFHIACVGDSLTAGHNWANESYPTKLSAIVETNYKVENCGVNGISITGYGGSWNNPDMRYIKQDVYQKSVNFKPDIFAIMLGTNDATGWDNAKETFDEYYHILLDS